MSYDNEDVWMMLYNLMKNCEYVVYDDLWFYVYLYIINASQYIIHVCYDEYSHPLRCCYVLWCLYSWGTNTQDKEL